MNSQPLIPIATRPDDDCMLVIRSAVWAFRGIANSFRTCAKLADSQCGDQASMRFIHEEATRSADRASRMAAIMAEAVKMLEARQGASNA